MPSRQKAPRKEKIAGISLEAIQAKTGKTWPQWLSILDKAGARTMNHKEIMAYLSEHHPKVGGWWTQMVTVGYEQARGLREKHQKPEGFEISVSKTIAVPAAKLFEAWENSKTRGRWLKEKDLVIRKATPSKTMRIPWVDGKSKLDVYFTPKGAQKSQVAVLHGKLSSKTAAARMKAYWAEALERLKDCLQ
jgi:uncharacterized protein YndB with AHSA1/START domain